MIRLVLFFLVLGAALGYLPASEVPAPADVAAPPSDAERTSSGLAYKVLEPGRGDEHPGPHSTVKVHYTGWTADGATFDSSVARGKPVRVPLDRLIPGWIEGVQLMKRGEKRRFWIPEELAYKGQPDGPNGMLVFDIELIDFLVPPDAPPDVAGPPEDARTTMSGLSYRILTKGHGKRRPGRSSSVTVHYTGWTTDGEMFDSSVARGQPANFRLDQVIAGWSEGLRLMVEGQKCRFWIPEKLAYKGEPGRPSGMLVFDVELLAVQN